ncbi:MAG TPA: methyltransferase domain-containing protein [Elusimicrobiota bacterium]|nr:methyltransferase domain-containing protein [Elusimicrobiota bacterium]
MTLFPDLSRPVDRSEWMDTRPLTDDEIDGVFGFFEFTNRRFGGTSAVLAPLNRWSARWAPGQKISLLDVGAGGADIPRALVRWARRRGFRLRVAALEPVPAIAARARRACAGYPEIDILEKDLRWMVDRGARFDYVTASLFLHHVSLRERADVLAALDRLACRGLILSDLRRSLPGYWAVGALAALRRDRVAFHDGPLSVRRAFRVADLENLAATAGLPHLRARSEPWFRVSLLGEKNG